MLKLLLLSLILLLAPLRWLFRLPWALYLALAVGAAYLAYGEYQTHLFKTFEAEFQSAANPPPPKPLSRWNPARDVASGDEVHIQAIYFSALETGTFDAFGGERGYLLLVDDLGREIGAALVVRPSEMPQLQQQLQAQGGGERALVTINGTRIYNSDWTREIYAELARMDLPSSADIEIIEPFLGDRATYLARRAEQTLKPVLILAGLAALLAVYGIVRLLAARSGARQRNALHHATQAKLAQRDKTYSDTAHSHTAMPDPEPWAVSEPQAAKASPWGTFTPIDGIDTGDPAPLTVPHDGPPPAAFKSVFPGGGSGFRFKSADEIILGTFGGLSAQRAAKRRE